MHRAPLGCQRGREAENKQHVVVVVPQRNGEAVHRLAEVGAVVHVREKGVGSI